MHRALFALMTVILIGCAGGTQITDFSKRAVVYTYIDVSDIPGNKLQFFQMRNLSVPESERYYPMGWEKLGSGYVVFHAGFAPGNYEFEKLQTMSCAGPLCSNTIDEFNFGPPGHRIGATRVGSPGVVFAGCYALKRTKRGFFRPGEFATTKTGCRISQKQMLSVILPRLRELSIQRRHSASAPPCGNCIVPDTCRAPEQSGARWSPHQIDEEWNRRDGDQHDRNECGKRVKPRETGSES